MTAVIIRGPLGRAGMDTRFHANYHGAGAAGFKRGMYGLFRPEWTAHEQAVHFANTYRLHSWELPPCGDFEIAPNPPRNLGNEIHEYLIRIEQAIGVRPVIYTGRPFWNSYVGMTDWAKDYDLWLAVYYRPTATIHRPESFYPGDLPYGWTRWKMWQFSSSMPGPAWGVESAALDLNWKRL